MEIAFNRNIVYSDKSGIYYLYLGKDIIKSNSGNIIQEWIQFAEITNIEKDIVIDKHARLIFHGTLLEINRNNKRLNELIECKRLPSHIGKYRFNEIRLTKVDTT